MALRAIAVAYAGGTTVQAAFWLSRTREVELAVDRPPIAMALTRPGQRARLAFRGEAAAKLRLRVEHIVVAQPAVLEITALRPAGAVLVQRMVAPPAGDVSLGPLPEAGVFVIEIAASGGALVELQAALVSV